MKDNNIPYKQIARYLAGEGKENEEFTPDVEQALQKVNHRIDAKAKKQSRRLFTWVGGAAAAVAVILISIFGIQYGGSLKDTWKDSLLVLETGINNTLEHELPDGSKIWLNRSSVLRYPKVFTGATREVYLEGEAFFDITPNTQKPFIIHANNTQTQVVGTSFAVRAVKDEEEVVVTVSTGIINLSAEGKADYIELKQGEQGICHPKEQKLEKNTNPDPNVLAWKTKTLIFRQTPLTEVARVLENTYHTSISVNSSIASLQLNSTFEERSLDDIMHIIEMTLQIQVRKHENGISLEPLP